VIDELMTYVPGADVVVLLTEKEPRIISGSIRTKKGVNSAEIAALFGGGGHPGAAGFKLSDIELAAAEEIVIGKIREYQARKPKLTPEEEDAILEQPSPAETIVSPEALPGGDLTPEVAPEAENLDQTE